MARRLAEAIEAEFSRPMEWGVCDCCLSVCAVLREVYGVDPARAYRGLYSSKAGAYRLMGPGGVPAVAERECARLGWPEIDPEDARDGDVGIHGRSLAIFCGAWVAKGERGLMPVEKVSRAWRPSCA